MSDIGFTKGPWGVNLERTNGHCGFSIEPVNDCTMVATVYLDEISSTVHMSEEYKRPVNKSSVANAHLISAAPDMYETLEAAKLEIDTYLTDLCMGAKHQSIDWSLAFLGVQSKINAALSKAQGQDNE